MGHRKSYLQKGRAPLPLAVQAAGLRHAFPDSDIAFQRHSTLTWVGQLQPDASSDTYMVKISYCLGERPDVTVLSPDLRSRNGEEVPHVFSGKKVCLYRARYGEWNPSMPLAGTIVPWASLWLLYYEVWLVTGKWCGSKQEHPGDGKRKEEE